MNRTSALLLTALFLIAPYFARSNPLSLLSSDKPLHNAALEEETPELLAFVRALLKHIDPNPRSTEDNTPLHLAIFYRRYALARTLIEGKADVNLCNKQGTALDSAAFLGDVEAVALLLRHGARVDIANSDGNYPIHQIVRRYGGHAEAHHASIIAQLLERGSVSLLDRHGNNALHIAIAHGNLIAVQALVTDAWRSECQLIDTVDGQNRNALLVAIEADCDREVDVERHKAILALLLAHREDLVGQRSDDGLSMVRCAIRALNPHAVSLLLNYPLSEADSVQDLIAYAQQMPKPSIALRLRQQAILKHLRAKLAPVPALPQAPGMFSAL